MTKLELLGKNAKSASRILAVADTKTKNDALFAIAEALEKRNEEWLYANRIDLEIAEKNGMRPSLLDRLRLDKKRIAQAASGVREAARLNDPVGEIVSESVRPNGLIIQRKRVPLGVIAIIYEARPNVTVDAAVLCLKAGNACILRGGKEPNYDRIHVAEACEQAAAAKARMDSIAAAEAAARQDSIARANARANAEAAANAERLAIEAAEKARRDSIAAAEKARLDSIAAAEELLRQRIAHINALKAAGESVTVHFETGGADLKFKPEEQPIIDEICAVMAEDKSMRIVITGHTDNTGNAQQKLNVWGKKRAEALKAYMVGRGVNADQIECESKGQEEPVADNSTAEGRAQNRRANIKFL